MSDLKIVGLAGEANVGKTELARRGAVKPYDFVPLPFAHRVKENTVLHRGFNPVDVLNDKTVESREAMQDEGTRIRRDVGSDALLESLDLRLQYYRDFGMNQFIVPDVRAKNERQHIQDKGGEVYRLTGRGGAQTEETRDHWTEEFEPYDVYDGIIINEEGKLQQAIDSLRSQIDSYRSSSTQSTSRRLSQ